MKENIPVVLLASVLLSAFGPASAETTMAKQRTLDACERGPDPDERITACNALIKEGGKPDYLSATYSNRAIGYGQKKQYKEAFADFSTAVSLNAANAEAYTGRAIAHHEAGDDQSALADYETALATKPDYPPALNGRGYTKALLNQLDEGFADCDRSVRLLFDPNAIGCRGLIHLKQGRHREGLRDFEAAVKMAPKDGSALYGRGVAKKLMGDTPGGAADMQRGAKLDPGVVAEYRRFGLE
jgi:tetratricopeptide (TPR) repeat protein